LRTPRNKPLDILAEPICWVKGPPEICSFGYRVETDCLARGSRLIEKRVYDETMRRWEKNPTTATPLLRHHELPFWRMFACPIHWFSFRVVPKYQLTLIRDISKDHDSMTLRDIELCVPKRTTEPNGEDPRAQRPSARS